MTQEGQVPPPAVVWAQRRNLVFVTICLEDCKDPILKIEPKLIYFKAIGGTETKLHEVSINLYKPIDPDKCIKNLRGRTYELVLTKKDDGPYWPRLTEENKKVHWLKNDYNKWKDEDDSEEENGMGNSVDLEEMMRQMGQLGGTGENKPNFDDLEEMGDHADGMDSDDDQMPDLE